MNNYSIIESILYTIGSEGIELANLKKVLDIPSQEIRDIIKELASKYAADANSGLCIKNYGDKFYLLTKKENHEHLQKLIDVKVKNPLSSTLIETLSIIAYNQPCTKAKIEEIRNIDPTFAVDRLIELELIENIGKADQPGSPRLYQVTQKFFNLFGIKNIKDLPALEDVDFEVSDDELNFFDSAR